MRSTMHIVPGTKWIHRDGSRWTLNIAPGSEIGYSLDCYSAGDVYGIGATNSRPDLINSDDGWELVNAPQHDSLPVVVEFSIEAL